MAKILAASRGVDVILQFYFARRFLFYFMAVLFVFFALSAVLTMVEQIRSFGDNEANFGTILLLTALKVPESIYRILPLLTILATLALFLSLSRSSELVVARASGRSAIRALMAPATVAALLGLIAVAVFNPIVAATKSRYELLANQLNPQSESILSVGNEGLWLRQGSQLGQTVINAKRATLEGTELFGVTFFGFTPEGTPAFRVEAERARLVPGAWEITQAKQWRFDGDVGSNPEANSKTFESIRLPSDLTRDQILDSFGTPSAIPIWDLPQFISQLERAGFSARNHKVWLQMELTLPILMVAMVLVGAGFTMRHARFGKTGLMVLYALVLGFSLYFIRNFAGLLGESGQLPIMLAAWGPAFAAILLPMGLLLHLEDG